MVELINSLTDISNKEDYYNKKYLIDLGFVVLTLYLTIQKLSLALISHLILLLWVTIATCYISSLHYRKKCDFIFYEITLPVQKKDIFKKDILIMGSSLKQNSLLLIGLVTQVSILTGWNFIFSIIIGMVHFIYAISIGIFSSKIIKSSFNLIIPIIFYLFSFINSSWWTRDEAFRHISPTIQLYNLNSFNYINLFSLIIISILLVAFSLTSKEFKDTFIKRCLLIILSLTIYGAFVSFEINRNNTNNYIPFKIIDFKNQEIAYRGIKENDAVRLSKLLYNVELSQEKFGLKLISKKYIIDCYYVSNLNFLYKTRMIPVTKVDEIAYINVFSAAMLNLDSWEIWTYVNIVDTFSRTILCNSLSFIFPLLGSKIA